MTNTLTNAVAARAKGPGFQTQSDFTFKPATKSQAKARIALAGPSGSGKTYTALVTASTMGNRIALVDTERGSASKYAGRRGFKFDTLEMYRYDPRDLVKALASAGAAGYEVVIVDSLSHFWSGTGGMLEQVDAATKRSTSGNSISAWRDMSPMEKGLIDALLSYPGHVIVTMRVKTEYIIDGKNTRKVGLKPEQRNGIEYEFDVLGDLDLENTLVVSKTRCPDLSGAVIRQPDAAFANTILAWLEDGTVAEDAMTLRNAALAPDATVDDLLALYARTERLGLLGAAVMDDDGHPSALGNLIRTRGAAVRAAVA